MKLKFLKFMQLVFLAILLFSCSEKEPGNDLVIKDGLIYKKGSDKPFTGRERAEVENRIIDYEFLDGYRHGKLKIYYENGTLQISGVVDSNRNVGKWQYFYPSGNLESEGFFANDLAEGRWVWYYPTGEIKEEGSYTKGKKIGWWKMFEINGDLIMEKEFTAKDTVFTIEDTLITRFKEYPF